MRMPSPRLTRFLVALVTLLLLTGCKRNDSGGFPEDGESTATSESLSSDIETEPMSTEPMSTMTTDSMSTEPANGEDSGGFPPDSGFGN